MGQYYKGEKIGTCENMYYIRLDDALELANQGEKDDDGISFSEYVADGQTKFRFPFPDEDGTKKMRYKEHKKDVPLYWDNELEHISIYLPYTMKTGENKNIKVPCPLETSSPIYFSKKIIYPRFEMIIDGKRKTVFACGECDCLNIFDDEEIESLKDFNKMLLKKKENFDCSDNIKKILERIK